MITNEAKQAALINEIDLDMDIAVHQAFILVLKFNREHHWTDEQIQQAYEGNSIGIQRLLAEDDIELELPAGWELAAVLSSHIRGTMAAPYWELTLLIKKL